MKKPFAKILASILAVATAVSAAAMPVGAASGNWKKDSKGWWYSTSANSYLADGWGKVDNAWYYFAPSGYIKTGWQKIDGGWYFFAGSGVMKTGWVQSGGNWFFMAGSGVMKTGWVQSGGKWYYMDDKSGEMITNALVQVGKDVYGFDKNGVMVTGDATVDGVKMSFDSSGKLIDAKEEEKKEEATESNDLSSGEYTMGLMGKYIRVNSSGSLELQDASPAQTFTVVDKGDYSYIKTEGGKYVSLTSINDGAQLTTGKDPYEWTITHEKNSIYSIRPVERQKKVVNANQQSSKNGTKIIIWPHTGATPQNAQITMTAVGSKVTAVTLDQKELSLGVGITYQLTGLVTPTSATNRNVTWTSANPAVAKVDANGVVTGVKAGTAIITVKTVDGGKTATCTVTVTTTAKVSVTGIKLDQTNATVAVGESGQITGTISPANATNKNVTWLSSNPSVATVDSNGVVMGVKAGTTTITAKTVDGGKTATCTITVTGSDTTAASSTLLKRYNQVIMRFRETQETLTSVGLYTGTLKTDCENFANQLNSNLGFIGNGTGVYTAEQISTANAILSEVDKMLDEMDQLIKEAEVGGLTEKKVNVTFANSSDVAFVSLIVDSDKQLLSSLPKGSEVTITFTMQSNDCKFNLEFTDTYNQTYTGSLDLSSAANNGSYTVTLAGSSGNVSW